DLGFLNPFYYKNPGAFNDITQGTNGNFNAGPGWDAVTGLGSPDGTKLLAALKAAKAAHQA
ncbi:MAG TPA: peptidase S53, partial [Candidatus Xenobia bacterium]